MKTFTAPTLRDHLICDSLSKRGDVFTARRGYFYTFGADTDSFIASLKKDCPSGYALEIVDSGDHWAPFNGGAPIARQSHWWVKFRLVPDRTLVESVNLMSKQTILIPACDKGTCLDPGAEIYWTC